MSLEVVSFADFFGDNPRVAERSREVVEKIARTNANELSDAVDRLVGLPGSAITYLTVDNIRKLEYARLIEELTAKRERGLLNDTKTSSVELALRGVKIVVDLKNHSVDEFTSNIGRHFGGEWPRSTRIESVDSSDSQQIGLNFANSRFRAIGATDDLNGSDYPCNIYIYGYLDASDFDLSRRLPLAFESSRVVRLETTGGDLWQNPQYTPTGLAIASAVA